MPKIIIEAVGLEKTYNHQRRNVEVLRGVDITLARGEIVSVMGPSGAGKSTLLYLLGLLEKPSNGSIHLDNRNTSDFSDRTRSRIRLSQIGFVFQFHHLLPEFTALENVMLPGMMLKVDRNDVMEHAQQLLNSVGLKERYSHKPGELSGGEQQRVAFARALVNSPKLILADEPTGNLDRKAADGLEELMRELCRENSTTLLIVTHNVGLAETADRKYQLIDGRLHAA